MSVWQAVRLFWLVGSAAASAPTVKVLANVPNDRLFMSSHATCAASLLSALGLRDEKTPAVAVIAGIEAAMYHCDCQANLHYWDIARGLQQWARLNFHEVRTEERCLRSENPAERLSFARYQQEIDAGRPVIVTFSFAKEAAQGLKESGAAQGRLSVLGIGYAQGCR